MEKELVYLIDADNEYTTFHFETGKTIQEPTEEITEYNLDSIDDCHEFAAELEKEYQNAGEIIVHQTYTGDFAYILKGEN